MDSFAFTLNKIAGAVLGTCLAGMGIGIIADAIYSPSVPKKPGFALPEGKEEAAGGGKKETGPTLPALLAKADPKKGEQAAQACGACHNFKEGAGAKVGPDLYGVVDREKGSESGFDYSAGMKKKGGKWTYADLDTFITKPSAYVQGTKMGFAGEENPEKRAAIIVYLRSLAKTPAPLPKVEEPAKTAEGGKKGGGDKGGEKGGGDQFAQLVATSDAKKGESAAGVCGACHNFKKGEGAKVGPPLFGVVDREKGSVSGFDYSAGVKKKGGKWTYDDLNQFLTKPAAYIQGTKMGYAGEANETKRAAIVAYLRTLADTPAPLPAAGGGDKKAEAGKDPQAKADGGDKKPEQGGEKKPEAGKDQQAKADGGDKKPEQGGEKKPEAGKDQQAQADGGDKKPEQGGGAADGIIKAIAAADPTKGQSAAQICSACHKFKKGEGNAVGPNLWGVVERDKGSVQGFDYSPAMKKKGGKWTFADLDQFITKPQGYVPGTKMGFPGEANEKKRANILAFLRTLADTPVPLPGAEAKK